MTSLRRDKCIVIYRNSEDSSVIRGCLGIVTGAFPQKVQSEFQKSIPGWKNLHAILRENEALQISDNEVTEIIKAIKEVLRITTNYESLHTLTGYSKEEVLVVLKRLEDDIK